MHLDYIVDFLKTRGISGDTVHEWNKRAGQYLTWDKKANQKGHNGLNPNANLGMAPNTSYDADRDALRVKSMLQRKEKAEETFEPQGKAFGYNPALLEAEKKGRASIAAFTFGVEYYAQREKLIEQALCELLKDTPQDAGDSAIVAKIDALLELQEKVNKLGPHGKNYAGKKSLDYNSKSMHKMQSTYLNAAGAQTRFYFGGKGVDALERLERVHQGDVGPDRTYGAPAQATTLDTEEFMTWFYLELFRFLRHVYRVRKYDYAGLVPTASKAGEVAREGVDVLQPAHHARLSARGRVRPRERALVREQAGRNQVQRGQQRQPGLRSLGHDHGANARVQGRLVPGQQRHDQVRAAEERPHTLLGRAKERYETALGQGAYPGDSRSGPASTSCTTSAPSGLRRLATTSTACTDR